MSTILKRSQALEEIWNVWWKIFVYLDEKSSVSGLQKKDRSYWVNQANVWMFGWKGLVKRILALEERRRHHGGPFLVAIHTPLKAFCLRHDLQKISFPYFPLLGIFTFGSLKIGKVQSAEVCNVWGWGEERPYCIFNCLRCNAHFPFLFYFRSTPTTESHFQLKILKVIWEVDVFPSLNVLASAWCSSILSILQKHNCQNVQIYLFQNLQINFSKFTVHSIS